ncbi:MAG: hypothetical protein GF408_01875 [Candidatus Omnitrophica bacterium]|nr:hypothetical protein [Candidatus Omnitrophota bacterium]
MTFFEEKTVVLSRFVSKDGQDGKLRDSLLEMIKKVATRENCINIFLQNSMMDSNVFMVYEA